MTDYERQLHDALSEVMDWIENWNPDFIQDDEWPATWGLRRWSGNDGGPEGRTAQSSKGR